MVINHNGIGGRRVREEGVKDDIHVSVLGSNAVFTGRNCGEEACL